MVCARALRHCPGSVACRERRARSTIFDRVSRNTGRGKSYSEWEGARRWNPADVLLESVEHWRASQWPCFGARHAICLRGGQAQCSKAATDACVFACESSNLKAWTHALSLQPRVLVLFASSPIVIALHASIAQLSAQSSSETRSTNWFLWGVVNGVTIEPVELVASWADTPSTLRHMPSIVASMSV